MLIIQRYGNHFISWVVWNGLKSSQLIQHISIKTLINSQTSVNGVSSAPFSVTDSWLDTLTVFDRLYDMICPTQVNDGILLEFPFLKYWNWQLLVLEYYLVVKTFRRKHMHETIQISFYVERVEHIVKKTKESSKKSRDPLCA